MNNAIRRFDNDVKKVHAALTTEKKAQTTLGAAKSTQTHDTRLLGHQKDTFASQAKMLTAERRQLLTTTDPAQLFALQQQVDDLSAKQDALHTTIQAGGTKVKGDASAVKRDKSTFEHAKTRHTQLRHKALNDLTPAEYKMNLKQTNVARGELGLNKLKHVLRPGQISPQGQKEMKKLEQIAKANASGKHPEGWCLKKVEDYLQTTSYGKIGHGNIPRFPYAHDFADYLNQGHRYEKLGLQKLNIHDPYKAPPGSIIVVRHGTPGTANPVAGDIVVRGYGSHLYNDGEMSYGGSGNFPKGNTYVLGIYAPK